MSGGECDMNAHDTIIVCTEIYTLTLLADNNSILNIIYVSSVPSKPTLK